MGEGRNGHRCSFKLRPPPVKRRQRRLGHGLKEQLRAPPPRAATWHSVRGPSRANRAPQQRAPPPASVPSRAARTARRDSEKGPRDPDGANLEDSDGAQPLRQQKGDSDCTERLGRGWATRMSPCDLGSTERPGSRAVRVSECRPSRTAPSEPLGAVQVPLIA